MTYNPDTYWRERGGEKYMESIAVPEYRAHQAEQELFIREHVFPHQPRELLDFGCGTGKLFHLWNEANVAYPHGYDISSTMINEARKTREKLYGDHLREWQFPLNTCGLDRTKLPYQDWKFDTIVACEVLAHIIPDEIEPTIDELARIGCYKSWLVIVTAAPFGKGADHNFDYDYNSLLSKRFDIQYDAMKEPYRHIVAVKKHARD